MINKTFQSIFVSKDKDSDYLFFMADGGTMVGVAADEAQLVEMVDYLNVNPPDRPVLEDELDIDDTIQPYEYIIFRFDE